MISSDNAYDVCSACGHVRADHVVRFTPETCRAYQGTDPCGCLAFVEGEIAFTRGELLALLIGLLGVSLALTAVLALLDPLDGQTRRRIKALSLAALRPVITVARTRLGLPEIDWDGSLFDPLEQTLELAKRWLGVKP